MKLTYGHLTSLLERKKNMLELLKNDSLCKVLSAVFYGCSSFSIMIINKSVLTSYHFPSFQALSIGQMLATILVLFSGKILGKVSFPSLSSETFPKVWPLPLFYLGN